MGIKVRHNGQWVEMGFAGAPGGEAIGTIIAWGGSAANIPSNFRLCDGQALSRTTYSELFSKLGTIHGSGDGSTTFNVPNLVDKFVVGANNATGHVNYPGISPGATGGSANATLPSHNHGSGTLAAANHRHNFPGDDHLAFANGVAGWNTNTNGGFSMDADSSSSGNGKMWYTTYSGSLTVSGSTASEGVSATNANLPPYYALCYIIKVNTSSSTGSGVPDGDYGDITVSSSGTVWNIDQDTVGPTELIATGVSAGTYTNPSITVDVDGRITAASSGGNIISTFIGLSDTPSTYIGSAGRVLVVNNTQNGVDFVDSTTIGTTTFIGLSDTPSSYTADKWIKVNSAANALEFVDAPSGGSGGGGEPVGTIMAWSGTSASIPAGYQLCDGGAAATADLQAITGSNVPDLRNRFIVGAYDSVGDTTYPALSPGAVGGSANAVLISHSHTYGRATYRTLAQGGAHGAELSNITTNNTSIEGEDINGNSSTSQTGTNANLPPYYALCYIIKHTGPNGSTAPGGNPFGLLTAKAATGTEVVFDNIPADAREITLMLNEVGLTNVSYHLLVQLGTSSGWIQTGYYASSEAENATYDISSNIGFPIHNRNGATSTGNRFTGSMIINLLRTSPSRTYTQIGQFKRWASSLSCENCASACQSYGGVDSISSDAEITRIRILANHTLGNVQSFTTGTIGVSYKSNSSGSGAYVDKITEGNTEAEVVDTGSDGHFKVTTEGTERLRITANGSVGIGTNNPEGGQESDPLLATKLDVYKSFVGGGDGTFVGRFYGLDTNVQETSVRFITKGTGGTTADLHNASDAYLMHGISNGDTKFVFGANGNVGIGTSVPNDPVTSSNTAKLAVGIVTCHELYVNGTQITGSGSGGGSGGTTKVAILSDVKSSGTAGGSFASGSWIDRTLNTEVDPESFVTFSSSNDYFALESGTYKINWSAPAYNTGEHKTQLVHANNTSFTSPTNIQGSSEFDSSGIEPNTQTRSFGETVVTITETTYFKLQHRCAATQNSNGLGIESNFSVDEVYSQIVVQDLSSGGGSSSSSSSSSSGNNQTWLADYQNVQSETGSNVEWTGIPEDTQRIIIMFHDVSPGSGQDWLVQLGNTSGNYSAGVYDSSSTNQTGNSIRYSTDGFIISVASNSATPSGRMVIERSRQDNTRGWVATGQITHGTGGGMRQFAGSFASSTTVSVFDRIRFTSENGTSRCFDGGHISILCEGPGGGSGGGGEPVGAIIAWAGTVANIPSDYQLCDGSAASTTELQAITGANVPNLTDKFIVGAEADGAGTTYPGLSPGATGGSANAVLLSHEHTTENFVARSNYAEPRNFGVGTDGNLNDAGDTNNIGIDESGTTKTDGSVTGTNKNLPPYYALCYIIKHTATSGSGGSTGDKIQEGDSKAEIIDTATESKLTVEIDATEKFSVDISGPKIHRQDSSNEGGSLIFNRAADDVAAFELDVYGSSSSDSGVFRIIDATGGGERFLIGPNGEIGLSGANYGSSGQVLTSNGSGSTPTWQTVSGGGGGTVSSGTFTATAGSPSTLESYTYNSAELVFEYTVFVKNGSDYQTQKLLVMRDGTTVDSSQYAVMYSNNLLVQLDATISGGNVNLRATPETGVNGSTTYRIKREVI